MSREKVFWGCPQETSSAALKGQPKQPQETVASRRAVPEISRTPHGPFSATEKKAMARWPSRAEKAHSLQAGLWRAEEEGQESVESSPYLHKGWYKGCISENKAEE